MFCIMTLFSGGRVNEKEPQTPKNNNSVLPADGLSTADRKKARIDDWVDDIIKRKPDQGSSGRKDKHRSLDRQQSAGSKGSANYVRSRSLESRASSERQRKQPGQGHGQPEGIYTGPRTMQHSSQGYGIKYSQLGPSNQQVNMITSQRGANQGHPLRPVMIGKNGQIMLDQTGTLIGPQMTGPGFNPSCVVPIVRTPHMLPPHQYTHQPVHYQPGSQMAAPRGSHGQSVQYHQQLGEHYLSLGQTGVPGSYPSAGQPDIPGNYASYGQGNSLGMTDVPGNYASHGQVNPVGQPGVPGNYTSHGLVNPVGQPGVPGNYASHGLVNPVGQPGVPGNYASHGPVNPVGQPRY